MAGEAGTPTQGNAGSNVFSVPTQMQNQQMGTLLGGNNSQTNNVANLNQATNQTPSQGGFGDLSGLNSFASFNPQAGGKGGGMMKPQQTAMGTPIIYGNTYLPQSQTVANTPAPVAETSYGNYEGGGGGGFADGAMSVPGYAYGTDSVAGYARGTMDVDDDPWSWTNQQEVAPLSVNIKPSNEQAMARMPDKTEQQLGGLAMSKGIDAATNGINTAYKAYGAPLTTNAVRTMGTTASGAPVALAPVAPASGSMLTLSAPAVTTAGYGVPASSAILPTVVGAGEVAAPLGSSLAGLSTGVAAAEGTALATGGAAAATPLGLGAAAGMGGEAALAAMGPVGMVIGGALLAKKLGIF